MFEDHDSPTGVMPAPVHRATLPSLAARLGPERHNRADAADAFDAALKINPKAVEALVGKGMVALERMDFAEAERQADVALKVNPKHPGALRLKADVRLAEADTASAEKLLLVAKAVNACDESTLARLAALKHLRATGSLRTGIRSRDCRSWA